MSKSITYLLLIIGIFINPISIFAQKSKNYYLPSEDNKLVLEAKELYLRQVIADSLHPDYNKPFLDSVQIQKIAHQINLVDDFLSSNDSFHRLKRIRPELIHLENEVLFKPVLDTLDLSKNKHQEYTALPDELKSFMKKYDFNSIRLFMNLGEKEQWYSIKSQHNYNYYALAKELRQLDVIEHVDYYGGVRMGDGNRYDFKFEDDKTICTISIGWGDCPSGCTHRRSWEFIVLNNEVSHSRTFGSGTKQNETSTQDCFYYSKIINPFNGVKNCYGKKINDSLSYSIKIKPNSIYFFNEKCQAIGEEEFGFNISEIVFNAHLHCLIGYSTKGLLFKYDLNTEKVDTLIADLGYLPDQMIPDDDILILIKKEGQLQLFNLETLENKYYQSKIGLRVDTTYNFIHTIYEFGGICQWCLIRYNGTEIDTSDYLLKKPDVGFPSLTNTNYIEGTKSLHKIEKDIIIDVGEMLKQKYNIQDDPTEIKLLAMNIATIKTKNSKYVFNLEELKLIYENSEEGVFVREKAHSDNFLVSSKDYRYREYDDQGNEIINEPLENGKDLCECYYDTHYKLNIKNTGIIKLSKWDDENWVSRYGIDSSWVDSKPIWLKIEATNPENVTSFKMDEVERKSHNIFCEFSSNYILLQPKNKNKSNNYIIINKNAPESKVKILGLPNGILFFDDKHYTCLGERCGLTFPEHLVETEDLLFEKFGLKSTNSFE